MTLLAINEKDFGREVEKRLGADQKMKGYYEDRMASRRGLQPLFSNKGWDVLSLNLRWRLRL